MKTSLAITLILTASFLRAEPAPIVRCKDAVRQNLLLTHPRPEYPREAREKHITGAGLFILRLDYETGHLREIHFATGTGSPILDAAVIQSLGQWQAKPRSLRKMSVPIAFWMSR